MEGIGSCELGAEYMGSEFTDLLRVNCSLLQKSRQQQLLHYCIRFCKRNVDLAMLRSLLQNNKCDTLVQKWPVSSIFDNTSLSYAGRADFLNIGDIISYVWRRFSSRKLETLRAASSTLLNIFSVIKCCFEQRNSPMFCCWGKFRCRLFCISATQLPQCGPCLSVNSNGLTTFENQGKLGRSYS